MRAREEEVDEGLEGGHGARIAGLRYGFEGSLFLGD